MAASTPSPWSRQQAAGPMSAERKDHRTLLPVFDELADRGNQPAVIAYTKQEAEEWTYERLGEVCRRLACGLQQRGIGHGQRVALLAENRAEWLAVCLGAMRSGATVAPLDSQMEEGTLAHVLEDCKARLLVTSSHWAERIDRFDIEDKPQLALLDAADDDERHWNHLLAEAADAELPEFSEDDIATLFYTSGTTGTPKGVPLTHANLRFQLDTLLAANIVEEQDRVLLPLPLHHVYPFVIGMLTPLALGRPIVFPYALTGPQIVRAIRDSEVTILIGVPRLYRALTTGILGRAESRGRLAGKLVRAAVALATFLRRRLKLRMGKRLLYPLHRQFGPKLRLLASGGSPLEEELALQLEGLGWKVATGYGLTETSPLLTMNVPGDANFASAGRPIKGVDLRIDTSAVPRDQEKEREQPGTEAANGEREGRRVSLSNRDHRHEDILESQKRYPTPSRHEGEILAAGPGVFAGYRNLPDKTEEAFTEDGYFRTGDLGYFDDDGFLHISGRVSTMIVTESGENIQPDDLEAAYERSSAIREIAVLQRKGDLVGLVVPDPAGVEGDQQELSKVVGHAIEDQAKRLPSYQRLADFAVTRDPLPRTRLGKLRRGELDERFEQAKSRGKDVARSGPISIEEMSANDRQLVQDQAARAVWDWLAEQHSEERLTPDTHLRLELGIDSMEWMNLTLEIGQRAGIELEDEVMSRAETVRDLLEEVVSQSGVATGRGAVDPVKDPYQVLSDEQVRWLEPLGPVQTTWARLGFGTVGLLMRALFRVEVRGVENLPEEGPYVLAPNHLSHLDPPVISAAFGYDRLRHIYWGGWTGVAFDKPLVRTLSRLSQTVPVDPRGGVMASLAFASAVLEEGKTLVWFPEGERSPTGELQEFRPGIGLLVAHHRVPIVPVSIVGTHAALPPGKVIPRWSRCRVTFGRPLRPEQLEEEGDGEKPSERIVAALRAHLERMVQ